MCLVGRQHSTALVLLGQVHVGSTHVGSWLLLQRSEWVLVSCLRCKQPLQPEMFTGPIGWSGALGLQQGKGGRGQLGMCSQHMWHALNSCPGSYGSNLCSTCAAVSCHAVWVSALLWTGVAVTADPTVTTADPVCHRCTLLWPDLWCVL